MSSRIQITILIYVRMYVHSGNVFRSLIAPHHQQELFYLFQDTDKTGNEYTKFTVTVIIMSVEMMHN